MINICLACDENYSKHAGVAIASVLANAEIVSKTELGNLTTASLTSQP